MEIKMIVAIKNTSLHEEYLKQLIKSLFKYDNNQDICDFITINQWNRSNSAYNVQKESLK